MLVFGLSRTDKKKEKKIVLDPPHFQLKKLSHKIIGGYIKLKLNQILGHHAPITVHSPCIRTLRIPPPQLLRSGDPFYVASALYKLGHYFLDKL